MPDTDKDGLPANKASASSSSSSTGATGTPAAAAEVTPVWRQIVTAVGKEVEER